MYVKQKTLSVSYECLFSSIPEDYKVNPGAVEAMEVHPDDCHKVSTYLFLVR